MKARLLLFTSLPPDLFSRLLPHLHIHPPKCAVLFDQLPHDTRQLIARLSTQMYGPGLSIRTKSAAPRKAIPRLNVTILTMGLTGDVYPYVHVAREFKARGHRVRVATHSKFAHMFAPLGVDFYPFAFDPMLFQEYGKKASFFMSCDIPGSLTFLYHYLRLMSSFYPAANSPDRNGLPFRTDVLIAAPQAHGYQDVAEWLGIPVHAMPAYPAAMTEAIPNAFSLEWKRPTWTGEDNRFTFVLNEAIPFLFMRPWLNLVRGRYGLPQVTLDSRRKTLVPHTMLYSPTISPPFEDWDEHNEVVGYPFVPQANYSLPHALHHWLMAGPPPIFISFGSMILPRDDQAEEITRAVVRALNVTGHRGLILSGWAGLGSLPEGLPGAVYSVKGSVPHEAIFPYCQAAVHHGGTGTTTAALRSGLPAVVIPFSVDQPYWGQRVADLGVGTWFHIRHFSTERLIKGIGVVTQPEVQQRAKEVGRRVAGERGAAGAVDSVLDRLPLDFEPGRRCVPWINAAEEMGDPNLTEEQRWHC